MKPLTAALAVALLAGCAGTPPKSAATDKPYDFAADPYPATYQRVMSPPVLLQHATVLIGNGQRLDDADVLLRDGKIVAVGNGLEATADAVRVDATGKWVTPGIIDIHSHLGVYPSPGASAHSDGNEATAPVTAQVWAEHSIWPQDPGFHAALAGGVTVKNISSVTYQGMKFPGAPWGLKMACGENPKRVYGSKGGPSTRMGNIAGYRAAFADAAEYMKKRNEGGKEAEAKRDLKQDTLAAAINGDIRVNIHCYRADEMAIMLDLAKEFGFRIAAFHHGVEAYKIADRLAAEGVCGALWADWWGFKMESFDGIQENIALVDRAKDGCAIVHSDSAEGIQRLNQEAAKVIASAGRVGIAITPEHAIRWITRNPAKAMGILEQTGTLEAGKMADVVLWNGNPFSSYAQAEQVYVDGARMYDRRDPARQPKSDFLLGQDLLRGGVR